MTYNNTNTPTAVFIDGNWLYAATRRINKRIDYAKFFNILINNFGEKTKIHFYGAINPISKQQARFYISLAKIGYIIHYTKLIKIGERFVSKGLDVELAVNAMRILPSLKKFILVSGDGDFAALLKQIIDNGVSVLLISLPFSTGYLLRKTVGEAFLNLETLLDGYKDIYKLLTFKKARKKKILAPNSLYIEQGDHFDSYIFIKDLMSSAKNNITIIDKYLDDQILTMIKLLKTEINTSIFTYKLHSADFCVQVKKLQAEGRSITVYKTEVFHFRMFIIDNIYWFSDYSSKDFGKKDSILIKITDKILLDKLKDRVAKISKNSEEICK